MPYKKLRTYSEHPNVIEFYSVLEQLNEEKLNYFKPIRGLFLMQKKCLERIKDMGLLEFLFNAIEREFVNLLEEKIKLVKRHTNNRIDMLNFYKNMSRIFCNNCLSKDSIETFSTLVHISIQRDFNRIHYLYKNMSSYIASNLQNEKEDNIETQELLNELDIIDEISIDIEDLYDILQQRREVFEFEQQFQSIKGNKKSCQDLYDVIINICKILENNKKQQAKILDIELKQCADNSNIIKDNKSHSEDRKEVIEKESTNTRLFISEKFKKEFNKLKQSGIKERVTEILDKIAFLSASNPQELNPYLASLNAKKFKNANNYWKFYATNAHRIIYAYGKDISRDDQHESIFILRYVEDHDTQGRIAKNSKDVAEKGQYSNYLSRVDEDDLDEEYINEFDIESEINYIAIAGKIEDLLKNRYYYPEVLLNKEQLKCVTPQFPLIFKGNAGSGKTIVSIEIMKMAYKESVNAVYITFTDGLRNLAKAQFDISLETKSNRFYSFKEYCLEKLSLSSMDFIDFYDFEKWMKISYSNISIESIEVWSEIRGIIKGYMGVEWNPENFNMPLLNKEEYLSGSGFESKFGIEDREKIYKIALNYNGWLKASKKFDDNDLANAMVYSLNSGTLKREVAIIVDEVQDMTERQIAMLELNSNDCHMYLSGDPNQIINPTLFSFERLTNLFYIRNNKAPKVITLKNNYRNCEQLVEYINNISLYRRKLIGAQKREDDALEIAMRKNTFGRRIISVNPSKQNLVTTLELFEETPDVAIIVQSNVEKAFLRSMVNKELHCVYTIHEVKGLEFNHVFCYNLVYKNKAEWNDILSNKGRRSTAHRFFFNVYYVAITRAKEYVCFFEDDAEIFFAESNQIDEIQEASVDNYNLNNFVDPYSWFEDGKKFEKAGLYEKAIHSYKKYNSLSGVDEDTNIKRCEALNLIAIDKSEAAFRKAARMLTEIKEWSYAERLYKDLEDYHKVFECKLKNGDMSHKSRTAVDKIESFIRRGKNDLEFMDTIINYYLIPKAKECESNCKIITDILIPETMEVQRWKRKT